MLSWPTVVARVAGYFVGFHMRSESVQAVKYDIQYLRVIYGQNFYVIDSHIKFGPVFLRPAGERDSRGLRRLYFYLPCSE